MSYLVRLSRLLSLPPEQILFRIFNKLKIAAGLFLNALRGLFFHSYPRDYEVKNLGINRFFGRKSRALTKWEIDKLDTYIEQILKHEFDLLGSGLTKVFLSNINIKNASQSISNVENINRTNQKWSKFYRMQIQESYELIDWHIDFKNNYSWSAKTPANLVEYGVKKGNDIKVPWELSRFQHGPHLALYFGILSSLKESEKAEVLKVEFMNQFYDFISQNPPGYGPNWSCTMDVAIRAVNLLIAYDIFRHEGAIFNETFNFEFLRIIFSHGRYIFKNLEYWDDLTSNHYLANISGLFFIACYLSEIKETQDWFVFSANELTKEMEKQFNSDGSNFEASTCYHRLSTEMLLYSVSLATNVKERLTRIPLELPTIQVPNVSSFPQKFKQYSGWNLLDKRCFHLLLKAANFSLAITRPDGFVTQVGDNDSGSFIKENISNPSADYPDHDSLILGINFLLGREHLSERNTENHILKGILNKEYRSPSPILRHSKAITQFKDFGLFILKGRNVWVSVRCGSVGQHGNGGHAHNDQLSFELCLGKVPIIVDPGTFVYTADPDLRNKFRETASHSTLIVKGQEQNYWLSGHHGLFSMTKIAATQINELNDNFFDGEHYGYSSTHRRILEISDELLRGKDFCEAPNTSLNFVLAPGAEVKINSAMLCHIIIEKLVVKFSVSCGEIKLLDSFFSPGYGIRKKCQVLKVQGIEKRCCWEIELLRYKS